MIGKNRHGVLVVGHGSRRAEANDDVREAARLIGVRGGFDLVEAAFLEIEQPDIAEGFKRLIDLGVSDVTVHPYFLSPGRHTRGDLPRIVGRVAADNPGLSYQITEPLSAHRLVIEASIDRIRQTRYTSMDGAEKSGRVYLVGAGPGAPELLTLRARNLLTTCDIVVYDNLVDLDVLRFLPTNAERVYVGKIGGGRQSPQSEINQLLIDSARAGKKVVRLKGGDPFLFGRGSEEALALSDAGVPFEIVPGVSSALAVPAYAGIPLTHRGAASSVAILTGATASSGALDVDALAAHAGADTIVILMGVRHLRQIVEQLIECGRDEETPVAVIRWGTYEAQQTIIGTLSSIARKAAILKVRPPAVIVIGAVVRLREKMQWFEKPLSEESLLEAALTVAV